MSDITLHTPGLEGWVGDRPAALEPGLGRRVLGYALTVTSVAALLFGAALAIALGLQHMPVLAPRPARVVAPPPPAWREIVKPVHIYDFSAPGLADPVYAARRHEPGGGREDVLSFGPLDGRRLALRLRIFRATAEPVVSAPLFADLAREAALAGRAVDHAGLPDVLPTRFGRFEIADVKLAGVARADGNGGIAAPCSGFRLVLDHPALAITGLACGPATAPLTRPALACLLERLDVAAARDDRELVDFFAASELRRDAGCAGMRLGPDGLHAPWLDDKPDTKPVVSPAIVGTRATSAKSLRRR